MGPTKDLHTDQRRLGTKEVGIYFFQRITSHISMAIPIDPIEHVCPDLMLSEGGQDTLEETLGATVHFLKGRAEACLCVQQDLFGLAGTGGGKWCLCLHCH